MPCAMLPTYLDDDAMLQLKRVSGPVPALDSEVWLLTHRDLRATPRAFALSCARQAKPCETNSAETPQETPTDKGSCMFRWFNLLTGYKA
jgi:hypothetical protein